MPKKKITPKKKKRVVAKAPKVKRKKSIAQQIDEFDWRDMKRIRVGEGTVARERSRATSPNSQPIEGERDER